VWLSRTRRAIVVVFPGCAALAPAADPDLTCSLTGRSRFENPLSPLQAIDRQPDLAICKLLLRRNLVAP
jgi:hypothetical protein